MASFLDVTAPAGACEAPFTKATAGATPEERAAGASELAAAVKAGGVTTLRTGGVLGGLKTALAAKETKTGTVREGACGAYAALCDVMAGGLHAMEPFLLTLLADVIDLTSAKGKSLCDAAEGACKKFCNGLQPYAVRQVVPVLLPLFDGKLKWQSRTIAIACLEVLAVKSASTALELPVIIPAITPQLWDLKKQVKEAAISCLSALSKIIENKDLAPIVEDICRVLTQPKEIPE